MNKKKRVVIELIRSNIGYMTSLYVKMSTWKDYLNTIYFDPEQPGAFAGPYKLYQILKHIGKPTTYTNVKKWLQKQDAFTLLKPVTYRFKRKRIVVKGIDDLWDVDLADVSNLSSHNKKYTFY